ncbi:endonuclease/exonuclease/phosphatase [Nannizzia gypsea CBS 118893]|uniref:Endonuclease/exonuclease/phosphatase n=1 Tax=Arthroderma gypseum (strain ATCC MYA-4604 / CBS 118893) TaxID=535722 RepID=E4V429_ARTGP|nr:endonuclease/exonuclease/phosphatase [Nannizzia gypsea CBS 118893]EFR04753.1 endonuclease/exonuclease/phosphatase [Nannizzia gypsea CBS 118893]
MKLGSLLFRILTHNIRYATTSPSTGEQPWSVRAPHIVNELDYHSRLNPESFVCLQEALHNQVTDVLAGLNSRPHASSQGDDGKWAFYGVGRNDGKQAGEYSPIFYRPAVWKLQEKETVWLSETPSVPSKGWDAASIRIVTIGVFNHLATNTTLLAMNTHLDDQGSKSRHESAKLILSLIGKYLARHPEIKGNFLAGDFNSDEGQEAYREFTKPGSSIVDTYKRVPASQRYGDEITFTGFDGKTQGSRIDYVMVGPQSSSSAIPFTVNGYAVMPNRFENRIYNSDHRAVVADVTL